MKRANMINELIRYYPRDRDLLDCSKEERVFNWVVKNALNPNNKRHLQELISIIDNMIPFMKPDRKNINKWLIFSAAVINSVDGSDCWNYTKEEVSEFINKAVADIAFDDASMSKWFSFAEALIEVREKAYYKRKGTIYWGDRYGGTEFECEMRLRKAMNDLDPWIYELEEYKEFNTLLEVIFGSTTLQWTYLCKIGFDSLRNLLEGMPDRMIIYRDNVYKLKNIKNYKEIISKDRIDDIEFDVYESGLKLELQRVEDDSSTYIGISDEYSSKPVGEIFSRYGLRFLDEKTRAMTQEIIGKHSLV